MVTMKRDTVLASGDLFFFFNVLDSLRFGYVIIAVGASVIVEVLDLALRKQKKIAAICLQNQ